MRYCKAHCIYHNGIYLINPRTFYLATTHQQSTGWGRELACVKGSRALNDRGCVAGEFAPAKGSCTRCPEMIFLDNKLAWKSRAWNCYVIKDLSSDDHRSPQRNCVAKGFQQNTKSERFSVRETSI